MSSVIELSSVGSRVLAYGYEAVARGALEADVRLVAGFPGNPASGTLRTLSSSLRERAIHVEYATNEKVAMEVAWGAAMSGQRALCCVNMLGTHVLVDALRWSANIGVRGGLVLLCGDDIGANTSGIESDSRLVGSMADIPVLEPADVQEAKDMAQYAFELSETMSVPVMLRSVNQLMMARSLITIGAQEHHDRTCQFGTPERDLPTGPGLRRQVLSHRYLHSNLQKTRNALAQRDFDHLERRDGAAVGIIGCGVCYSLAKEALGLLGLSERVSLLKLGVINPLNKELVGRFLQSVAVAIVMEEGEAFVEAGVQALVGEKGYSTKILGRLSETIPFAGELFMPVVESAITHAMDVVGEPLQPHAPSPPLLPPQPGRTPTLCAGCPHIGTFYALRKAIDKIGGRYLAVADAGCAWMGTLPPAKTFALSTNMGGAIGLASGAALMDPDVHVIAVVGDGALLHGGLMGLVNAYYNQAPVVALVLDNRTLANTGLQPTANSGRDAAGNEAPRVDVAGLCGQVGLPFVEAVNPLHPAETTEAIYRALKGPKPAVVVAVERCTLIRMRDEELQGVIPRKAKLIADNCNACGECMELRCPAICWEGSRDPKGGTRPIILLDTCVGCDLCVRVCTRGAIVIQDDTP
jgi:indolepyruvate ferredoxin oxidoreductase alpha subunit